MKKSILLLLFIIPLICYGQLNDTIFYKNRKIEPVYSIDLIYNNRVFYTPKQNQEQLNVRLKSIERITSKDESILNQQFTNSTQNQSIYRDTIYLKSGKIKPDVKIIKVTPENILYSPCLGCPSYKIKTIYIDTMCFDKNFIHEFPEIKITPVQYNLHKFYRQKRAGHICMGVGVISSLIYVLNPIENSVFGYIAGGLGLAAYIIDIDSYKWIKRASLETSTNNVSLKIKL